MQKPYFESSPAAHHLYIEEKRRRVEDYGSDQEFLELSQKWRVMALERKYMNNFSWLGRPLIQMPSDVIAVQELIWSVKPDLIIETGVAHGGSLILSASILELIGHGQVLGIDIEIRDHNRQEIQQHRLANRINLLQGSSVDPSIVEKVVAEARCHQKVMVFLDSNHTHDHVYSELNAYAHLVSTGSYCVVFDTFIEDMSDDYEWTDRPWSKGNNPRTAVNKWLEKNPGFVVDTSIEQRLLVTSAPGGFLLRVG